MPRRVTFYLKDEKEKQLEKLKEVAEDKGIQLFDFLLESTSEVVRNKESLKPIYIKLDNDTSIAFIGKQLISIDQKQLNGLQYCTSSIDKKIETPLTFEIYKGSHEGFLCFLYCDQLEICKYWITHSIEDLNDLICDIPIFIDENSDGFFTQDTETNEEFEEIQLRFKTFANHFLVSRGVLPLNDVKILTF